jgi:hypothetical protein
MQLTEPIVFVRLSFSLPGQQRQINSSAAADSVGAKRDRVRTIAKLFASEAFSAITAADTAARGELLRLAIRVDGAPAGAYILPRKLLGRAVDKLETAKSQRTELVSEFLANAYDAERARAQTDLGSAYDPRDYPPADVARNSFNMRWQLFALDVPENLPDTVREAETAKLRAQIDQVATECRQALRIGLADLVQHLVDRLQPDADGRRKRLAETTVDNLRDFLATIAERDITADSDIRALADKAKAVIGLATAEDLRNSNKVAERISSGLADVAKSIEGLIKTDGARAFDLSDAA